VPKGGVIDIPHKIQDNLPRSAWKAGSAWPRLARKTALITLSSTVGKASLRISSFFCASVNGRGGFGGGTSSVAPPAVEEAAATPGAPPSPGVVLLLLSVFPAAAGSCTIPDSWPSSSSSSKGRAVVGDSGMVAVDLSCIARRRGEEREDVSWAAVVCGTRREWRA